MQFLISFSDLQIVHYPPRVPDLVEVFALRIDDFTERARLGLDRFDLFGFLGELVPKMFKERSIESINVIKIAGVLTVE
ncbi:hypothetical protein SAMN05421854_109225 [Amycolatopsis rubida]|uniref:Uncharacterized protein n=1 Tax=Amycolatopsis rubida TaxID=112413 RepID=A0A1I5WH55_9PSEU|nr:hypothetical protein SAMN05421854_109225 [Amycolatopsis rubida]